jgi:mxaA protein
MKIHVYLLLLASLLLGTTVVQAQGPDARIVAIANPVQSNGIHIGDVLTRNVIIAVKPPYQLSRSSFPSKGVTRDGLELVDFSMEAQSKAGATQYQITLSYQVFSHSAAPAVMRLPAERLMLSGGPQAHYVEIPAWQFWFSPLVLANITTAKSNLQPQVKPEPIDESVHYAIFSGCLALLAGALVALVYLNADKNWLLFMGGPFAQAHRRIKRIAPAEGGDIKALHYLHQAFNQVHGGNLFAGELEIFLARHPAFSNMKTEIASFFERSSHALFAAPPDDKGAFIREMVMLSRSLRDCERGVK